MKGRVPSVGPEAATSFRLMVSGRQQKTLFHGQLIAQFTDAGNRPVTQFAFCRHTKCYLASG
jgi:hypothetical protein